jgi:hypothetical protein
MHLQYSNTNGYIKFEYTPKKSKTRDNSGHFLGVIKGVV